MLLEVVGVLLRLPLLPVVFGFGDLLPKVSRLGRLNKLWNVVIEWLPFVEFRLLLELVWRLGAVKHTIKDLAARSYIDWRHHVLHIQVGTLQVGHGPLHVIDGLILVRNRLHPRLIRVLSESGVIYLLLRLVEPSLISGQGWILKLLLLGRLRQLVWILIQIRRARVVIHVARRHAVIKIRLVYNLPLVLQRDQRVLA